MHITVQYVEGCPHLGLARQRVAAALDRLGIAAEVDDQAIRTDADASAMAFRGSPTILVDGEDRLPSGAATGLSCRLYRTGAGMQGAPSVEQLVEVLAP